jgi:RNA polymerase sigma-B factor
MHAASAIDGREKLIEGQLPLVERIASRFVGLGEPREDLLQVGALALVRAVDRLDPARAELLPAYAARCVEGEIRRHLRDHRGVVRVPRAAQASGAARAAVPLEDDLAAPDPLEERSLDRALLARAATALDRRERRIVALHYYLGLSQDEVAARVGVSQVHVSRLLRGAVAKMRRRVGVSDA